MYRKVDNTKNKIGFYLTSKYMCYTLASEKFRLYVYNVDNESEILFVSEEERINRYNIYDDTLVYISRNESSTYLVNLKTKEKRYINKVLYGLVDNYYKKNKNYCYDDSYVYVYDLFSGDITQIKEVTIIGFPELNTENKIITSKESYIYIYSKSDFSLLWEKDLSEITSYTEWDNTEEQGEIREVYVFENSI